VKRTALSFKGEAGREKKKRRGKARRLFGQKPSQPLS